MTNYEKVKEFMYTFGQEVKNNANPKIVKNFDLFFPVDGIFIYAQKTKGAIFRLGKELFR